MALSLLAAAQRHKKRSSGSRKRKSPKLTLARAKAEKRHIYKGKAGGKFVLKGPSRSRVYL